MAHQQSKVIPISKGKESSLGYPLIEKLLETEDFATINKSFGDAYQKLEAIMKDHTAGLKKQKDARQALRSFELTTELIKHLLEVKHELVKQKNASLKQK